MKGKMPCKVRAQNHEYDITGKGSEWGRQGQGRERSHAEMIVPHPPFMQCEPAISYVTIGVVDDIVRSP